MSFRKLTYLNLRKAVLHLQENGFSSTFEKISKKLSSTARLPCESRRAVTLPIDPTVIDPHNGLSLPDVASVEPTISIIIPVYNQWRHTWNCLATLTTACRRHSFEVILADDNSTDQTATEAPLICNLRIVKNHGDRGFVNNCNSGAAKARGSFLFFLNNDTKCCPGSIDALADMLLARPEIGVVGSKLLYPDGILQECGGIVWSDGSAANYGNRQQSDIPGFMHPRQVDYVSGAALMVRRSLWDTVGGFDTRYAPAYYEDTDLAMSARSHGYEVWVEPASLVIHYEGASNGTDTTTGLKAYQVRNREVFAAKWVDTLESSHLPPGSLPWLASERPHYRSTVLVVDHYIPTPDQDAGSACTFHYLETLAGLGHRVLFLGENFARTEPYTAHLERLGIEALVGDWCACEWRHILASRAGMIDLVIFNRPHITEKFLPTIRKLLPQARCLYFGHDLHFLREERAAALTSGDVRSKLLLRANLAKRQEAEIYRQVDGALTISTDEADQIRKAFAFNRVEVFPGYVYPIRSIPHPVPSGKPTILFVGGFGHAPNQDGVDWFIAKIWPLVRQSLPEARFWIVGSKMPPHYAQLGNGIEALGRLSDQELAERYAQSHLVTVPLRYGAGLKGKVVQALCEGLPMVSTLIGVEGLPVDVKRHLEGTDEVSEFASRIVRLCTDPAANQLRRELSLGFAQEHFSRESSRNFFRRLVDANQPVISWRGGLLHDGWIGKTAFLRVMPGTYRMSVWAPEFHFLNDASSVELRFEQGHQILGHWPLSESGITHHVFNAETSALITVSLSRTTVPNDVQAGPDQRQLGLKLVNLNPEVQSSPIGVSHG